MSWVKLDDRFPTHPKLLALGDDYEHGLALYVQGLCYCAGNLTDGLVPSRMFRGEVTIIGRLVEVGLWEPCDGGWMIHDYLDYNPSREQVEAQREAWRERQSRSRSVSRGDTNGDTPRESTSPVPPPVPPPVPDPSPQPPSPGGEAWRGRMTDKQLASFVKTFGIEAVTREAERMEQEEQAGELEVKAFPALLKHRLEHPVQQPRQGGSRDRRTPDGTPVSDIDPY